MVNFFRRLKHAWRITTKGLNMDDFNRCLNDMGIQLLSKRQHETSKYRLIQFAAKLPKRGKSKGNGLGRNGI